MSSKNVLNDFDVLLNWDNLQDWIAANDLPGSGPVTAVSPITGGSQNALFMMTRGNERLVLRRPPKHLRPNSNETMRREARVLTALKGSSVPHAAAYGACDDESVIGATFYVMAPLEGYSPMRALPEDYANNAQWRREMGAEMMRAAAELSKVDYIAAGLSDFGKPGNYFGRQVERWTKQYRLAETETMPEMERLIVWLPKTLPEQTRTSVVHGDYRIDNMIFDAKEAKVVAVLDWELSTLGDPLADFTYVAMAWVTQNEGRSGVMDLDRAALGIPELDAMVERYCAATNRDGVPDMNWYFAYNFFRLAGIIQGIKKRVIDGTASSSHAQAMAERVFPLAESAWKFAERAGA